MDLKPFSGHKTECPKCASRDVGIRYCFLPGPQRLTYYGPECPGTGGDVIEHFHRSCKACGFEWLESVPAKAVEIDPA